MGSEGDFFSLLGGLTLQVTHFDVNRARCDIVHSVHPVNRLLFIREDTAGRSRICDREMEEIFPLQPGRLYFMPCFREVEVHLTPELEFLSVHFTMDLFGGTDIFQKQPVTVYSEPEFAVKAWSGLKEGRSLYAACELKGAVYRFCTRTLMQLGPEATGLLRRPEYRPLIDFIAANASASTTVEQLAEFMEMRPDVFSRKFSADIGMTPKKFLTRFLLRRASDLLLRPGCRVKEVAAELGFSSEFYFSRFFHKNTGIPPRQYREFYQNREEAWQGRRKSGIAG